MWLNDSGLAIAAGDGTIWLWHPQSGQCDRVINAHEHWVWFLDWHPDGSVLASGSYDHTVKLWQIDPEVQCIQTLKHPTVVSAIAWHPHGKWLATSYHDGLIRIWGGQTGHGLATLGEHTGQMLAIAFSQDGQSLYSSSQDETLKIWTLDRVLSSVFSNTRGSVTPANMSATTTIRPVRPYEAMNITGVRGLTSAQRQALKTLGAHDDRGGH